MLSEKEIEVKISYLERNPDLINYQDLSMLKDQAEESGYRELSRIDDLFECLVFFSETAKFLEDKEEFTIVEDEIGEI
jgi:hypothetical protein